MNTRLPYQAHLHLRPRELEDNNMEISTLQADLYNIFTNNGQNVSAQAEDSAQKMAAAIDRYIRTAIVNVTVTGNAVVSSAPGDAPVTGNGTGSLS